MSNQREILSKNLKRLLKSKGVDQKDLADHLGISEMSISNWVNGVKYPRMPNIQKLADYFGVMKSDIIEDKEKDVLSTSATYNYFPTAISAGTPFIVDGLTDSEKITVPDEFLGKWKNHKDIFFARISGDSMDKLMDDGSIIAIKPVRSINELKNGDIVVYSLNGEYSVKRYSRQGENIVFKPQSYNDCHFDHVYNIDDSIKIHGVVVTYIVNI